MKRLFIIRHFRNHLNNTKDCEECQTYRDHKTAKIRRAKQQNLLQMARVFTVPHWVQSKWWQAAKELIMSGQSVTKGTT